MERSDADSFSFAEPKSGVAGLAEPRRICEDGLEQAIEIAWRTADDAEDLVVAVSRSTNSFNSREVAVCCSRASVSSRVSSAFFFLRAATEVSIWGAG
jgi:hypothetical protein